MSTNDSDTTLQELKNLIIDYSVKRGWDKHHTPKNLAASICIEAAKLLEHFQWDDYNRRDKQAIADELADILIYAFNFAETCDIDIATAYKQKLAKAAKKYPVALFNPNNDSQEEFFRIKKAYRQKKDAS